ncbi:ABC-2 type transporter [uncultured archaeon]|nr:ABC-2 type transporter [uncultured archaeon]
MSEIGAIYTLWLREMIRFVRSKSRIAGNFTMPFLWLAVMGTGLGASIQLAEGVTYLSFIGPGVIGMSILFSSIFSGVSVIWDRQFGFMKEILVTPVSRTSIVIGKIAGSATISLINGMVILLLTLVLGAIPLSTITLGHVIASLVLMALIASAFVSIGLIIASVLNNTEGFQLIMNLLVMPLFFISGAVFPLDKVPDWMKGISLIDPLMYGVDGLRGVLLGVSRFSFCVDLGVLAAFCAVMVMIATYTFSRMKATT